MKKPLILIIEDDNDVRYSLEDGLREENFPVLSAGNGKQGLQILDNFPMLPELIIIDSYMPVMSGDVFRKIQLADEKYKNIPVIMISNNFSDSQIVLSPKEVHLRKPIDVGLLLETISLLTL